MARKYYNTAIYIIIAIVVVFFVAFRFFNTSIQRQLEVQMYKDVNETMLQELRATREEEIEEEKNIADINKLTPYTIKVQKKSMLLQNQHYWDSNTKAVLEGTDVIERMDEVGAFTGNKKTSEQFNRQIERMDARIAEYKQKVLSDPGDDYARQKLQSLFMLKSTVSGLENTVVKENR